MRRGGYPKPQMTSAQAMVQARVLLASCPDEKLFALTPERLIAMHKIKLDEATVVLRACQETRRREIATKQAVCREFGNGQAANREGQPRANNPHRPSDELYAAWDAGWGEEEGPAFQVAS